MNSMKKLMIVALPVLLVAGCETMSDSDRTAMQTATKTAGDARTQAMQAAQAANQAAAAARDAAAAANRAAAEAKAASDKSDAMFRRNLRK